MRDGVFSNRDSHDTQESHENEEDSAAAGVWAGPVAEQNKLAAVVYRGAVCTDNPDEGPTSSVRISSKQRVSFQLKIWPVAKHAATPANKPETGGPVDRKQPADRRSAATTQGRWAR